MRIHVEQREPGTSPLGLIFMLPLFALPLGAWAVQKGWIVFGTCGFKLLVGVPCLTCGATRATIHLLHGHFGAALAMQPLIVVVYAALLVWGTVSLAAFVADRSIRLEVTSAQDTAIKVALLSAPIVNWMYLIAAGV